MWCSCNVLTAELQPFNSGTEFHWWCLIIAFLFFAFYHRKHCFVSKVRWPKASSTLPDQKEPGYRSRVSSLCVSEALPVHVGRYFGSVEGSKFVEMASVDNVKRTLVNYGGTREWSDPTQGQVGGEGRTWLQCMRYQSSGWPVQNTPPLSLSHSCIWQGEEFLYCATEVIEEHLAAHGRDIC